MTEAEIFALLAQITWKQWVLLACVGYLCIWIANVCRAVADGTFVEMAREDARHHGPHR